MLAAVVWRVLVAVLRRQGDAAGLAAVLGEGAGARRVRVALLARALRHDGVVRFAIVRRRWVAVLGREGSAAAGAVRFRERARAPRRLGDAALGPPADQPVVLDAVGRARIARRLAAALASVQPEATAALLARLLLHRAPLCYTTRAPGCLSWHTAAVLAGPQPFFIPTSAPAGPSADTEPDRAAPLPADRPAPAAAAAR